MTSLDKDETIPKSFLRSVVPRVTALESSVTQSLRTSISLAISARPAAVAIALKPCKI